MWQTERDVDGIPGALPASGSQRVKQVRRRPPPYHGTTLGNWSQSTATLLPSFRGFPGGAICYRLPPVASPGLDKSGVVGHEHRLEPRSSPGGDHARAGADEDPRMRFDPLDEVVGHRLGERVAAHDDRHPLGELGQVERGLAGRVDAADDDHLAVAVERRLARRGAIEDAGADQALDPSASSCR